jgi:hypothetical protein
MDAMMYDPLALDRQRQDEAALRRRAACRPAPADEPTSRRHRRPRLGVVRRLSTALTSL